CKLCGSKRINKPTLEAKEKSKQELLDLLKDTPYKLVKYIKASYSEGWCTIHQKSIKLKKHDLKKGHCPCEDCAKELGRVGKSATESLQEIRKKYPDWEIEEAPEKFNNKTNLCGYCKKHDKEFPITINDFPRHGGCPLCMGKKKFKFTDSELKNIIDKNYHGELKFISKTYKKTALCCKCRIVKWNVEREFTNTQKFREGKVNPYEVVDTATFIAKCKIDLHSQMDYSQTEYKGQEKFITFRCPIHGLVPQVAHNHLRCGAKCPTCSNGFSQNSKLNLISKPDLYSMPVNDLITYCEMGMLPAGFKVLAYTLPNSQERLNKIAELQGTYANFSDEEATEKINNQIAEQEKRFEESSNSFDLPELGSAENVINSTKFFDDDSITFTNSTDNERFLIVSALHRLWNSALNDEENFVKTYKSDPNQSKWFNYIRDRWFTEYDAVKALTVDENCKFPYTPNLMQKLMVYRMRENDVYGNWSDAGAGKSFSRDWTSRVIDAHTSLYVVPNSVKDTTQKAILEAYPDSNIIIIDSIKDIVKLDTTKHNYLV
ncbi:MAG: hypothetical protein IKO56_07090, partial [Alphaproteobacteria bacterium]|nr:hypothetical protein [Alphaproteobacteria bacterium]